MNPKGTWRATLGQAAETPPEAGRPAALLMVRGSRALLYDAPEGRDPQTPHDREEVYVVARGEGSFLRDGERVRFGARDTIFVPAGTAHRFENFSGGFFYGPRGAEAA